MKKMKKCMSFALSVATCLGLFQAGFSAGAAETHTAVIRVASAYVSAGGSAEVPITVTTNGLYAVRLQITLDEGLVPLDGEFAANPDYPCPGILAGSVFTDIAGRYENGTLTLLLTNGAAADVVSESGTTLITLSLRANAGLPAGTQLNMTASVGSGGAAGYGENPVAVTTQSGKITVAGMAPQSGEDDVGYSKDSLQYDYGTLAFGTSLTALKSGLPAGLIPTEYGTVFFRNALIDEGDELVIGYRNAAGKASVCVSRAVGGNGTLPDKFYAVLRDSVSDNGSVSDGYLRTKYAARSFVKCYDPSSGAYTVFYGNRVVMSAAQKIQEIQARY